MKKKNKGELDRVSMLVAVYCKNKHGSGVLCAECSDLLAYAAKRLQLCPYDPKPKCKECRTHCYDPGHRDRIRQVMRFSGMHMVKRGRLDLLFGYFLKDKMFSLLFHGRKAS